jgi:hypothetical protein
MALTLIVLIAIEVSGWVVAVDSATTFFYSPIQAIQTLAKYLSLSLTGNPDRKLRSSTHHD